MSVIVRIPALVIATAFLFAATINANEIVDVQIDSKTSSTSGGLMLLSNLPGSLIGDYDEVINPTGTLTRPGLFGGSGNQPVPLDMTPVLDGVIDAQPTGSYQLALDLEALTATISNFELDALGAIPASLGLSIELDFDNFRTFQPDSLFPGVPLTVPVGDGTITVLTIEQDAPAPVANLVLLSPNQYSFSLLVPATITLETEVLGQPLAIPPLAMVLALEGELVVDGNQIAITQAFEQVASNEVTDIPNSEFSDIPFPAPTVLPPGQTANLLLSGVVESLTFDLDLNSVLSGAGILATAGDTNNDGDINLLDVAPFVDALLSGNYVAAADINCDGTVNLLDVAPFIELLTN